MPTVELPTTEAHSAIAAANPMMPEPWTIRSVSKETPDTFTLVMEPANGARGGFTPGQFSMLWVFGVGELPISIIVFTAAATPQIYTCISPRALLFALAPQASPSACADPTALAGR